MWYNLTVVPVEVEVTDDEVEEIDRELGKVRISNQYAGNLRGESSPKEVKVFSRDYVPMMERGIGMAENIYTRGIDLIPFTGFEDIDKILNMKQLHLSKDNQLILMWGCTKCWMRGTTECPYMIKNGETALNKYCDFAIKSHLIKYRLMKSADGLRHIRNINLANLEDMLQYYISKLQRIKDDNRITKAEVYLVKNVLKMYSEFLDKIEKSIVQDEGITIKHEGIDSDTWDRVVRKSKIKIENMQREVEGQIVNELGKDGKSEEEKGNQERLRDSDQG